MLIPNPPVAPHRKMASARFMIRDILEKADLEDSAKLTENIKCDPDSKRIPPQRPHETPCRQVNRGQRGGPQQEGEQLDSITQQATKCEVSIWQPLDRSMGSCWVLIRFKIFCCPLGRVAKCEGVSVSL